MEHVSFRTPHKKELLKLAEKENSNISQVINKILKGALKKKARRAS